MSLDEILKRAEHTKHQVELEATFETDEATKRLNEIAPIPRKKWVDSVTNQLWMKQGGKCAICHDPMSRESFDVDHIVPHSKGGGNERTNLRLTHVSCNRSRGNNCDRRPVIENLEDRAMNLK
tara:strand:+ start:675 stop:1043 length:369 start_codon:yes stop_codon:yes gene_type:complete